MTATTFGDCPEVVWVTLRVMASPVLLCLPLRRRAEDTLVGCMVCVDGMRSRPAR